MQDVTITISGPSKTGKSTLTALIGDMLAGEGFDACFTADTPAASLELNPSIVQNILAERKPRVAALKDKIKINIREEQSGA